MTDSAAKETTSSHKLQPVRGTHDLIGESARAHRRITEGFRRVAETYAFEEIATPVFEFTEVFRRTLGESSDVVTKEMYSFEDRSGDSLTLRPEYTAGIARAWLSHGLASRGVVKLYGFGPMFRHERPQKGRQRQFHQLDAEIIGAAEPAADIELIAMAWQLLGDLGIAGDTVLHLNTLGDPESRRAYREVLVSYFTEHLDALSDDSRERLNRNPLRILDSKDPRDKAVAAHAPAMADYLNAASRDFYEAVREGVRALEIPFVDDPHLVRGLDYYTHTAFEFITDRLGAQGAVLAGGRYDGLIEQMGGPPTPGVGWAAGIERLAMLLPPASPAPRLAILMPLGEAAERRALPIARDLRAAGVRLDVDPKGNMKKRLNRAARRQARYALILGEDELARKAVAVRDLDSGEQEEVAFDTLCERLKADASPSPRRPRESGNP